MALYQANRYRCLALHDGAQARKPASPQAPAELVLFPTPVI